MVPERTSSVPFLLIEAMSGVPGGLLSGEGGSYGSRITGGSFTSRTIFLKRPE
jgi:hypothetical protein